MISLNISIENINIKDVKMRDLPRILQWYNDKKEYKYATGIDYYINLEDLTDKYLNIAYSKNEFFVGIYLKDCGTMIGILKGILKEGESTAIWLNYILIDKVYQGHGYGGKALKSTFELLNKNYSINTVYVSVVQENYKAIRFWLNNGFKVIKKIQNHIFMEEQAQDVVLMKADI